MRALSSRITKTLVPMSTLTCADNSGAATFKIIHKLGKGHKRSGLASAGIGDIVSASVIKGTPTYLKKPVHVMIIRQRSPMRRSNGMRVRFEDNAGIMVGDDNLPIGTEIKGAMAREVVERFAKMAGIASRIV